MIKIEENRILSDETSLTLPFTIEDAFETPSGFIVLFKPTVSSGKSGKFYNLRSYSKNGDVLWSAEFPDDYEKGGAGVHYQGDADVYYGIRSKSPLIAYTFSSYTCQIDLDTGKIINKTFTK